MSAPPAMPPGPPSYADRLRGVTVHLRADLDITRHVFHDEPSYIVRDPLTFQAHQVSATDYQIIVALGEDRTLGEVFADLVARERLDPAHEEPFYEFIVQLHRLGFLNLPMSDDKALYQRFLRRRKAERAGLLMAFLFFRVPLINPDALLDRTIRVGRLLFTRTAFVLWALLMVAAGSVAILRRADLAAPLLSILDAQNIALLWIQLVGLKVLHEFGHAYACKRYGGQVPEMGVLLIAFTPCAYVDATASWGFVRKRERIIVCLAGMYVESIIAAVALFVWSATNVGGVNTFAYQTFMLASLVTVGFNINPLMRYDGYYVMSDLIDMPNLRQRATRQLLGVVNRWCLGLPDPPGRHPAWVRVTLIAYGIASTIYKVVLVTGICAIIAMKFFLLGLVLAGIYFAVTIIGAVNKTVRYLWLSPATAPVRARAVAVSILVLAVLPAAVAFVPIARPVEAGGIVVPEHEHVVRARTSGFIAAVLAHPRDRVDAGTPLVILDHPETTGAADEARARRDLAAVRVELREPTDLAAAQAARERLAYDDDALADARRRQADLRVTSARSGDVLSCRTEREIGTFVAAGDEIARIASGVWELRVLARAENLADAMPTVGQLVTCRGPIDASRAIAGRITALAPVGSRRIVDPALTQAGGGDIVVNPTDHEASEAFFEIRITFTDPPPARLEAGMTMQVRFDAVREPLGDFLYRRFVQFTNRLRMS